MVYLSCMTTTTSSFDAWAFEPFVCVNCGHEHDYEDTIVRGHDGGILCEDVAACEARGFMVDEPEDPGIDPEERSLSTDHLEEQASARYEDRYGSWDDHDGPDDDSGWDD